MFVRLFKWALYSLVFLAILTVIVYQLTAWRVNDMHSNKLEDVPNMRVGLVLGTSQYLSNGRENLYFRYRIKAAVQLYQAKKVEFLLVSGDNRKKNYNEPKRMQEALVKEGIPLERIHLDYAGFRTLASVVRAQKVFGLDSFTIVSQPFHNERALYIAQSNDLTAYGFDAQKVNVKAGLKTRLREYLARVKMFLDLYVLYTEPKFLGERVNIE
jgi:SanA protein